METPYDYFTDTDGRTPFRDVQEQFKQYIDDYVFDVFTTLVDTYSSTIDNIFLIFITLYFISVIRGVIQPKVTAIIFHLVMVTFVFTVLHNWWGFTKYIYDLIVIGPAEIISTILSVVKTNQVTPEHFSGDVLSGMDIFLSKGMRLVTILWGIDAINAKFASVIVLLFTLWLSIHSAGLIIYAQIIVALLLSLAPIFMLMLLFQTTRGWFEGWMRALMTAILLQVLVFSLLALSLSVLSYGIGLLEPMIKSNDFYWGPLLPFLLIVGVTAYILTQIWGQAAAIGGGLASRSWEVYNDTGGTTRALMRGIDRGLQRIKRFRIK